MNSLEIATHIAHIAKTLALAAMYAGASIALIIFVSKYAG